MKTLVTLLFASLLFSEADSGVPRKAVRIQVDPLTTRCIDGISELDRKKYFNLADHGVKFGQRVPNDEVFNRVTKKLNVTFGRSLGPVRSATGKGKSIKQDPSRPQFIDVESFKSVLDAKREKPNSKMRRIYGKNLGIASHGGKESYPEFMGRYFSDAAKKDSHAHSLPNNVEAAAELAAMVFKHSFNDLERPEFFEPINEPHWSYFNDPKLSDWHLAIQKAFQENEIPTQVGGMCMSVCYMYNQNYRSWNGFKNFLDRTNGELDFYSFHVYDYLDFEDGDFVGRVQSGLPLEGVFDLVANYSNNQFGKAVPIVVSEHGGYVSENKGMHPDEITDMIAREHFPGEGFDWEMEKRSILDFNLVSSILTNTLNFIEHPHLVQKAVPFILLDSMGWDPKYYATLYTPYDFKDRKNWVPTRNSDFFEFCKSIKGRRVKMYSSDPDVQLRAFVDGRHLHLVLNNLSDQPEPLNFVVPKAKKYFIKKLGRGKDFRPYLNETEVDSLEGLDIQGREAILISAEYPARIPQKRTINEIPYYADAVIKEPKGRGAVPFNIEVDDLNEIDYVMLRVGFRRPPGSDWNVTVRFNGKELNMPVEDCAGRLENSSDFATTRIAYVNPKLLKQKNRVTIKFPDGKGGTVGSVVLRVARKMDTN